MPLVRSSLVVAMSGAVALAGLTLAAAAQGQNPAVPARQGHMQVMQLHLGILGDMARGNTAYDAEAAQIAADNLVAVGAVDQRFFWPEGTDSETYEGSRALPALFAADSTRAEIQARFSPAAEALAAAAGQGLEALQGAIGPVGGVCGDCHQAYRARN